MDAGTADSVLDAAERIKHCSGRAVMWAVWRRLPGEGIITLEQVHELGEAIKMTNYGQYLMKLK